MFTGRTDFETEELRHIVLKVLTIKLNWSSWNAV